MNMKTRPEKSLRTAEAYSGKARRRRPYWSMCAFVLHGAIGLACMLFDVVAWAGIPEPSLVLYGKVVLAPAQELVTQGRLEWTYTPSDGGAPVTVQAVLRPIEAAGGPYSYVVQIPAERQAPDWPVSAGVLALADAPIHYARSVVYKGDPAFEALPISIEGETSLAISATSRGSVERVDVFLGDLEVWSSADVNRSGTVDAVDVQLIINAALGLFVDSPYLDVNDDQAIDALDVQLVIIGALGLDAAKPGNEAPAPLVQTRAATVSAKQPGEASAGRDPEFPELPLGAFTTVLAGVCLAAVGGLLASRRRP
jgi:hypothetical protein